MVSLENRELRLDMVDGYEDSNDASFMLSEAEVRPPPPPTTTTTTTRRPSTTARRRPSTTARTYEARRPSKYDVTETKS